jgi:hypothetical protein
VHGTTQEAALSYSTNATASYRGLVVNSDVRAGDFTYDVALSFAGEQRAYVQKVAAALRRRGIRPFYDDYEKAALWGKDLYEHLDWIYRKAARYCVLFASKDYAEKVWATHERRDLGIVPSALVERMRAMASIGFEEEIRSDEEHGDDVLVARWVDTITYEDDFTNDFAYERATEVAVRMLDLGIGEDGCRQCAEQCIDSLDFSLLASSTTGPR